MARDLVDNKNSNNPPRRDVTTTLKYYKDPGDGSEPMPVYVGGDTVTNKRPVVHAKVTVHDISGEEDKYKLDIHGFQFLRHESKEKTFDDEERIKSAYYKECEEIYKRITGASHAHLFGHLVRRGPTHWHDLGAGNATKKGPLHRVHIDQSYTGAEMVLRKQVPDHADELLQSGKRWQIINLWRPVSTIYKDPLAVASAPSIAEKDLVEAQVIYTKQAPPLNRNLVWTILPNPEHRWYFKNEQKPDEVLLIKCFDSCDEEGLARRAPHCAFKDSERDRDQFADRESIEIRAVVIYDE